MAKVKDRLIFETKKMDAVAQRKSNKEQKLLSKEKQSNKLAEKSKRKKDHFAAVDDWAKTAAQNRGPALREDDNANLGKMNTKRGWKDRDGNIQEGPNKKRMTADTKYGFGGKKGRFKQNDPKAKNDMSGFNPKGNFSGSGTKSKGGAGAKRQGKRARDAGSSRKSSR
jgi:rRNA-processing protein EBP2